MTHLPVYQHRKEILDALEKHQVIVVESPTGSGKTTQMPIILHEAGYTKEHIVGITQPRRIAALSVSDFIAKQLDAEPGFVGYKMRFSDTTGDDTHIKVMTDGILLMELKSDPLLSRYAVMLIDEAHERSLNIDFVLGMLKHIITVRPEFRVIVSSATINASVFSKFFDGAPIISINARAYPVDIIYRPLQRPDDFEEMMTTITTLVEEQARKERGDILVFLPGEYDIKVCMQRLQTSKIARRLIIYPLFGRLSKSEQERVFIPTPAGKTKVVVATNIAETSVTIDGITTVIDSGIAKINYYNQKNFTSALVSLPISRSSCEQRAGRAGRTAPGVCFRLYQESDYRSRPLYGTEEILRTDLSEVVLRMSELGIFDYEHFSFITRPKPSAIASAQRTLQFIQAIDENRHLTSIGRLMVRFPLLPRHSRVIVEALLRYPSVLEDVIIAVAFLSSKTPFILPPEREDEARKAHQRLSSESGDFVSYLNLYRLMEKLPSNEERELFCERNFLDYPSMVEIHHVATQIADIVSELGFPLTSGGSTKEYLICLASGLLQFVCIRTRKNQYKSLTADQIYIHPGSDWFREPPRYLLSGEIVQTSRMYARTVSPLKKEWLEEILSGLGSRLATFEAPKRKAVSKERIEVVQQAHTITVYNRQYPLIPAPKGNRNIACIPIEDLSYLAKSNLNAPHRPRNFPATLQMNGQYIHFGERFFTLLHLDGKLQPEKGVLSDPPSGMFFASDPRPLIENLDWIGAFCRMKNRKHHLAFVQLEAKGNGVYRFSRSANCFEAMDSSLYAINQLLEDIDGTAHPQELRLAKKAYEKLTAAFET